MKGDILNADGDYEFAVSYVADKHLLVDNPDEPLPVPVPIPIYEDAEPIKPIPEPIPIPVSDDLVTPNIPVIADNLEELKRLDYLAEQERLEAIRLAEEQAEQERLEAIRLAEEQAEQERLEAIRLAEEQAERERLEAIRIAEEQAERERLEAIRSAEEQAERERLEALRLAEEARIASEYADLHPSDQNPPHPIDEITDEFAGDLDVHPSDEFDLYQIDLIEDNYNFEVTELEQNEMDEKEVIIESGFVGDAPQKAPEIIDSPEAIVEADGGYVQQTKGLNVAGYIYPYEFLGITVAGGALGLIVAKFFKQGTLAYLSLAAAGLMAGSAIAFKVKAPLRIPKTA